MLPVRKNQSPEERAREIEGALDWMRNNDVQPEDEGTAGVFGKLPLFASAQRSPEEREKDLEEILGWM